MGGRGASSSISKQSLESRISSLEAKMLKYSKYALPSYRGADKEQKSSEFYRAKKQYDEVSSKLRELLDKQEPVKLSESESEKRIREQREFTRRREREITSLSYERAKKRQERDVNNWFGLNRR